MPRLLAALAASFLVALPAAAQELAIGANDTLQTMLAAQKGKRVTVRLCGGQEQTGTVRDANAKLLVLGAPAGRELFDAAIPLEKIEAVFVRTKQ
jgi:hypothetical protein